MIFTFEAESPNNVGLKINSEIITLDDNNCIDGEEIDPVVLKSFLTEAVYNSLPSYIISNYKEYLVNTSKFVKILTGPNVDGLFDNLAEYENKAGMIESGKILNTKKLESLGINLDKVLFFRITINHPEVLARENYWTTDLETFISMYEIPPEDKNRSNILISNLSNISEGGIVNIDQMDTNGVSIHLDSDEIMDSSKILGSCTFIELLKGKSRD